MTIDVDYITRLATDYVTHCPRGLAVDEVGHKTTRLLIEEIFKVTWVKLYKKDFDLLQPQMIGLTDCTVIRVPDDTGVFYRFSIKNGQKVSIRYSTLEHRGDIPQSVREYNRYDETITKENISKRFLSFPWYHPKIYDAVTPILREMDPLQRT
jgi:hypothetical protein